MCIRDSPCVPFLKAESLKLAYDRMVDENANAIMPVCKYPVPIEWAMRIDGDVLSADNVEAQKIRSQDIKPAYYDVGMFYFYKTDVFLTKRTTLFPNTVGYVIDELECQDIDTMEDWKIAENKYKLMNMGD